MKFRLKQGLVPAILLSALFMAVPALASHADTLMARSHAAEAKGRLNDAFMLMQAAVVATPAKASSYVALADLYVRHGKADFARKYYDEALELDPTLPQALAGIGHIDLMEGQRADAQKTLAQLERSCGAGCKETAALRAALASNESARADERSTSLDKR